MTGPLKRSVAIAGHATSISLEPAFWDALHRAAASRGLPLSALVARIDAARVSDAAPANLASAVRVWLLHHALAGTLDGEAAHGEAAERGRGDHGEKRSQ